MKQHQLCARQPRHYCKTTDSNHEDPIAPNLLDREFTSEKINKKWVGDVTYIATKEGWLYLAVMLDLCSRRVVGWCTSEYNDRFLVKEALEKALRTRRPTAGLLAHSDQGSTYASDVYNEVIKKHGLVKSMSRRANCWDNAVSESFFGSLKRELLEKEFLTRRAAHQAVLEYMEYYNIERRHSTLGYISPVEFELKRYSAIL